MYQVVNIPHAKDDRAQLAPEVDGAAVKIVVIDPKMAPPYNKTRVCDLYIGDHMFQPAMQGSLREMVAKAIISGIEAGRRAGYAQAQADIRDALGVPRR